MRKGILLLLAMAVLTFVVVQNGLFCSEIPDDVCEGVALTPIPCDDSQSICVIPGSGCYVVPKSADGYSLVFDPNGTYDGVVYVDLNGVSVKLMEVPKEGNIRWPADVFVLNGKVFVSNLGNLGNINGHTAVLKNVELYFGYDPFELVLDGSGSLFLEDVRVYKEYMGYFDIDKIRVSLGDVALYMKNVVVGAPVVVIDTNGSVYMDAVESNVERCIYPFYDCVFMVRVRDAGERVEVRNSNLPSFFSVVGDDVDLVVENVTVDGYPVVVTSEGFEGYFDGVVFLTAPSGREKGVNAKKVMVVSVGNGVVEDVVAEELYIFEGIAELREVFVNNLGWVVEGFYSRFVLPDMYSSTVGTVPKAVFGKDVWNIVDSNVFFYSLFADLNVWNLQGSRVKVRWLNLVSDVTVHGGHLEVVRRLETTESHLPVTVTFKGTEMYLGEPSYLYVYFRVGGELVFEDVKLSTDGKPFWFELSNKFGDLNVVFDSVDVPEEGVKVTCSGERKVFIILRGATPADAFTFDSDCIVIDETEKQEDGTGEQDGGSDESEEDGGENGEGATGYREPHSGRVVLRKYGGETGEESAGVTQLGAPVLEERDGVPAYVVVAVVVAVLALLAVLWRK